MEKNMSWTFQNKRTWKCNLWSYMDDGPDKDKGEAWERGWLNP